MKKPSKKEVHDTIYRIINSIDRLQDDDFDTNTAIYYLERRIKQLEKELKK